MVDPIGEECIDPETGNLVHSSWEKEWNPKGLRMMGPFVRGMAGP